MALLRLTALLLALLTVVYACLWAWVRAGQRARLEAEWARERPPLPRHTHVAIGLDARRPALRRRLVLWVYAVPVAVVAAAVLWFELA